MTPGRFKIRCIRQEVRLCLFTAAFGLLVWVVVSHAEGVGEAWDSPVYWTQGLLAMMLLAALVGFFQPCHAWRWGVALVLPQMLYMMFSGGLSGNSFPLMLLTFAIIMGVCGLCAYIGAGIRYGFMLAVHKGRIFESSSRLKRTVSGVVFAGLLFAVGLLLYGHYFTLDGAPVAVFRLIGMDTTLYAPGYTEKAFLAIPIGADEAAVLQLLGPPLQRDEWDGQQRWCYTGSSRKSHHRYRQLVFQNGVVVDKWIGYYME